MKTIEGSVGSRRDGPISNPLLHGVLAFVLWGCFPVYYKVVQAASPTEILAHRVIWSASMLLGFLLLTRRIHVLRRTLADAKLRAGLALTAVIIASNWLVFIWAVNHGHVLEASLGYFICPLINCLFGYLFYAERLAPMQKLALVFAAAGVSIPLFTLAGIPWISLYLALSFASYGSLRKKFQADPIASLCLETVILSPLALLWLLWLAAEGHLAFASLGFAFSVYLMLSGLVTALPLVLFTSAANRIPLTTIGFLQYIAPSLQFLLALFAFGEAFVLGDALSFACIWIGLVIYSVDQIRRGTAFRAPRAT